MGLLSSVLGAWAVAFALVKFAESRTHGLVSRRLLEYNVSLYLGFVSVTTTRFNLLLERLGKRHRRVLNYWFTAGVIFGLVGLVVSVVILSANLHSAISALDSPRSPATHPRFPAPQVASLPAVTDRHAVPAAAPGPWWLPRAIWRFSLPTRDHEGHHVREAAPGPLQARRIGHGAWDWQSRIRKHDQGHRHLRHFLDHLHRHSHPVRPRQTGRDLAPEREVLHGRPAGNAVDRPLGDELRSYTAKDAKRLPLTPPVYRRRLTQVDGAMLPLKDNLAAHDRSVAKSEASGSVNESRLKGHPSPMLTPLLPGITIPASDLWYIAPAILIAAVLHELGHALAAGMLGARVSGVGGFLALMFPGAYVQLTGIEALAPLAQLKIYCAGAWHNLMIAVGCLGVITWLPFLVILGYSRGDGALVVSMPSQSPLLGFVEPGDLIVGLGQFPVRDGGPSFRGAVSSLVKSNDTVGFCVSERLYRTYSKPLSHCCEFADGVDPAAAGDSAQPQCFSVVGIHKRRACLIPAAVSQLPTCRLPEDCAGFRALTLPPASVTPVAAGGAPTVFSRKTLAIGPEPRLSTDESHPKRSPSHDSDSSTADSSATSEHAVGDDTDTRESCFVPVLPNNQQLVDIQVRSSRSGDMTHFFYEGYPQVLGQSVTVSSYVPRLWAVAPAALTRVLAAIDFPNVLERLLQYLSSISLALAILNMAPVFRLDGEASSVLFVRLFVPNLSSVAAYRAKYTVLTLGTTLLVLNVLFALLQFDAQALR